MDDFETIIAYGMTENDQIEIINAAVAGATQDVLDAMPKDAWR